VRWYALRGKYPPAGTPLPIAKIEEPARRG